jgi:ribose/xylose/arabinose/galactoside ABC-type transport system permease subunit
MNNKISGILMLFIYVCVASTLLNDAFVSEENLRNLLRWSSMFGVIGIGAAFVIITGGIDLSIGSTIGLLGCLFPMLLIGHQWSMGASLGTVLVVAIVIGLAHGLLITKMKLQPFVVTLCGLLIYRGLARYTTGDQTQGFRTTYDDSLRLLATGAPCSAAFVVMVAGVVIAVYFLVRGIMIGREPNRSVQNFFGLLCGVALAVAGSSRYWYGYEITPGSDIDVIANWRVPTWQTTVPPEAAKLPSEILWWCGLMAIPFAIWFVVTGAKGNPKYLRLVLLQLVIAAGSLPVAIVGCQELLAIGGLEHLFPFSDRWAERWHMFEVFLSLGIIMGTLAWCFRSGIRAGGDPAKLPAMATGITAIMWLMGKSQIARDWMWDMGWPDALLGLAGKTHLLEVRVPAPFFVLLVLAVLASVFLNLTIFGRYLLALGRNEQAARYSGIRTDRMVILAYVLCSLIAGIGAILFALDGNAVQPPVHGNMWELYAIAAAVLGGCSLRGGEGSILGVVIGAAVVRVLYNSISLLGIASQLEYTIIGLVILLGVLADEIVKRLAARRRAAEELSRR